MGQIQICRIRQRSRPSWGRWCGGYRLSNTISEIENVDDDGILIENWACTISPEDCSKLSSETTIETLPGQRWTTYTAIPDYIIAPPVAGDNIKLSPLGELVTKCCLDQKRAVCLLTEHGGTVSAVLVPLRPKQAGEILISSTLAMGRPIFEIIGFVTQYKSRLCLRREKSILPLKTSINTGTG